MKCPKCGAELEDGVLYCRECGAKIEAQQKRYCRECGAEITPGAKFCPNCGAKIISVEEQMKNIAHEDENDTIDYSFGSSSKSDIDDVYKQHSNSSKTFSKSHIDVQNIKKSSVKKNNSSKWLICLAIILVVFVILQTAVRRNSSDSDEATQTTQSYTSNQSAQTNYTIEKGTEYAFMSDEWNVYIATAVSDSIIKVEHWDKTLSSTKTMSFSEDIGTYKINDNENGFSWIDNDHTAFTLVFQDNNNSRVKKAASHIFTIDISADDKFKGTDYDERIACYTYTNDDWHMYRAIPLSDSFIKIECWSRSSSLDSFCFGWDWCLININDNDVDFEWTDDEHTSFTISTKDPQNKYYWKDTTFVLFENENPDYQYTSIIDFLRS